jgi:hypothetical protein
MKRMMNGHVMVWLKVDKRFGGIFGWGWDGDGDGDVWPPYLAHGMRSHDEGMSIWDEEKNRPK